MKTPPKSKYGYIIGRYSLINHLVDYKSNTGHYCLMDRWCADPKYAQIYVTSKEAEDYRQKKSKGRVKKILFISKVIYGDENNKNDRYIRVNRTIVKSFTKLNSYQILHSIIHKL